MDQSALYRVWIWIWSCFSHTEISEDGPSAGDTAEGPTPATPPTTRSPLSQEREAYKKLGLTKQVLAAHTQKEEQAFLNRFKELRGIHTFKADYLVKQKGQVTSNGEENIFWACNSVIFICHLVQLKICVNWAGNKQKWGGTVHTLVNTV